MKPSRLLLFVGCLALLPQLGAAEKSSNHSGFYPLQSFGPVATPEELSTTFGKAVAAARAGGGGAVVIPASAPDLRGLIPGSSTNVTVIDLRQGSLQIAPPNASGLLLSRTFRTRPGQSSPHWTYHPMVSLQNNVIRGSNSHLDWLQADVKAGKNQRFYVASIRGLYPGMFINAHGHTNYQGGVQRLWIQSLGYDSEKHMPYFIADTAMDHKAGAILHNKTHINAAKAETFAHSEARGVDVLVDRRHYSQGDAYLFGGDFRYMGDVHSASGDENGVIYAAFSESDSAAFRGTVESVSSEGREIIFAENGAANAHTLGSGRPLINTNPKKWITAGKVLIVRPGSFTETEEDRPGIVNPVFGGKTYPTAVRTNPTTGESESVIGGLIRASPDAPWTADVVGRYFAINEENEKVPGCQNTLRWYRIVGFSPGPDGTKEIRIERKWWGAHDAGSPTLYQEENYSTEGNVKPLAYIIAPGANVYDVSGGVTRAHTIQPLLGLPWKRQLKISPTADATGGFAFEPGDTIEQAIGADPFKVASFRAWMWDQVPGVWPAPVFNAVNWGAVTRDSVLAVRGGRPDGPVPFETVFDVTAPTDQIINFKGFAGETVMKVHQKNRPAPVRWIHRDGKREGVLQVDHQSGEVSYTGGTIYAAEGFINVAGISGSEVPARNLRGIAVDVAAGNDSAEIRFPKAETDASYAVFIETSWLTDPSVSNKQPGGFTVRFSEKAPADAEFHWLLVR